ncbi:hypothetical protein BDV12DRAFT_204768 [Aspergillus spectabilis]
MSGAEARHGALPTADVARFPNAGQVPDLLIDWWATGTYGIDHSFPEIDFIVPDSHFDTAIRTLVNEGFHHCQNPQCSEHKHDRYPHRVLPGVAVPLSEFATMGAENLIREIACAHFHLEHQYTHFTVLSHLNQSNLLWSLPPLTSNPVADNDPTFMVMNNVERLLPRTPRHGSSTGPWADLDPVKTLTHSALVEALLQLRCRDVGPRASISDLWDIMFVYSPGPDVWDESGELLERLTALRRNV